MDFKKMFDELDKPRERRPFDYRQAGCAGMMEGLGSAKELLEVASAAPMRSKLNSSMRSKIAKAFDKAGLTGKAGFKRVGEALTRAFAILDRYDIEIGQVATKDMFPGPSGSRAVQIAFSNRRDPASPVEVQNSMLHVSWHQQETGLFEIVMYLT